MRRAAMSASLLMAFLGADFLSAACVRDNHPKEVQVGESVQFWMRTQDSIDLRDRRYVQSA
jgi:hypothetical protein